jgi:membrane protein implicated in regulation of membrane protease activity
MSFIWLAVIILLVIVEAMSINLTTIWFVISGLVALVLSFIVNNFIVEFTVFTFLGVFLLITTRPILTKMIKLHKESTNLDRVIGMKGIVTEEIKKNGTGEVKVDGKRWTAYADKKISVDSTVEILEINGVKIKVKKVEE